MAFLPEQENWLKEYIIALQPKVNVAGNNRDLL